MKVHYHEVTTAKKSPVFVHHCGGCNVQSAFVAIGYDLLIAYECIAGQRKCPRCSEHVFVVFIKDSPRHIYPAIKLDFNTADIPQSIVDILDEALLCHANGCDVAAGIMLRRTLEEICAVEGFSSGSLGQRIANLQEKVTMPKELFEAMHELKLLGNDAAHVEAKDYLEIGKTEIGLGIFFVKEILKAVYQTKKLLDRFRDLKMKRASAT